MFNRSGYRCLQLAFFLLIASGFAGCGPSDTSADRAESIQTVTLPAQTVVAVRIEQGISAEKNSAGESFRAVLDQPIQVEGGTLVPAGTEVKGEIVDLAPAGRIKGRAEMTLTLQELALGDDTYAFKSDPLTLRAQSEAKKDAGAIAGGAAVGAVAGAIVDGKEGALKGGAIGGAAGTVYVLATKGDDVKLEPGAKLLFTLKGEVVIARR